MGTPLSHRGWTAAEQVAPCVICQAPAILRSPRGRPCHWGCAVAWHQQHDQAGVGQEGGSKPAADSGGITRGTAA